MSTVIPINEVVVQDQIQARFDRWRNANPIYIEHFRKFALEAKASGRKQYGISAVTKRVRWHVEVEKGKGEKFRISNDYRSRLAHYLMQTVPELEGFFKDSIR